MAIAPPEFENNLLPPDKRWSSVNSNMPYSLRATLSLTFRQVQDGVLNIMNWNSPRGIHDSVFLMHCWQEEKEKLREKLTRIQPDIVFIGTFAMNFPGAIAAATLVRGVLPDALIVL